MPLNHDNAKVHARSWPAGSLCFCRQCRQVAACEADLQPPSHSPPPPPLLSPPRALACPDLPCKVLSCNAFLVLQGNLSRLLHPSSLMPFQSPPLRPLPHLATIDMPPVALAKSWPTVPFWLCRQLGQAAASGCGNAPHAQSHRPGAAEHDA